MLEYGKGFLAKAVKEVIMGNMSYCRFINTLHDLQDCEEHMEDELSEREQQAREKLIKLCQDIAENYGE